MDAIWWLKSGDWRLFHGRVALDMLGSECLPYEIIRKLEQFRLRYIASESTRDKLMHIRCKPTQLAQVYFF